MDLSIVVDIAQVISSFAVVVSVAYLAIQMHQNRTMTKLQFGYKLNDRLNVSLTLTSSSGNPYTPILGRIYMFSHDVNESINWISKDNYLVGDKNSDRYDKYFRVDAGFDFTNQSFFGLFNYDWYFQCINISNHLNVMQYYYRTKIDPNTGNQVGVERRPLQMFPLIITAGVKFEF